MKLVTRDGRVEIWQRSELIGYVEDETLYAIVAGYAEPIGTINHASDAIPALVAHKSNKPRSAPKRRMAVRRNRTLV